MSEKCPHCGATKRYGHLHSKECQCEVCQLNAEIERLSSLLAATAGECEQAREAFPVVDNDCWWCPECGDEVHPQQVTFDERHTRCGNPVIALAPCEKLLDSRAALDAALAAHGTTLGELAKKKED